MIDAYSWRTSNGRKLHIVLEELELEYKIHPIDIRKGDQFEPEFLKISPNNKIPAIVDQDGPGGKPYPVFESGAILMYLAEKTGRLMPTGVERRYTVIQWLMFQMGGIGPMLGQANHFRGQAPDNEYGVRRYTNEAGRLYGVMDTRLRDHEYLAGDYSIADIACYPWLQGHEKQGQDLNDFPHVKRWLNPSPPAPASNAASRSWPTSPSPPWTTRRGRSCTGRSSTSGVNSNRSRVARPAGDQFRVTRNRAMKRLSR